LRVFFSEIALQKCDLCDDNNSQNSSRIGGLYNPVILSNMKFGTHSTTGFDEQVLCSLEDKLKIKVDFKKPILRKFSSRTK
jgi:hypothetical protein